MHGLEARAGFNRLEARTGFGGLEARAGFSTNMRRNKTLQRQQSRLDELRAVAIASLHPIDEERVPLHHSNKRASETKRTLIFAVLLLRAKLRIVHKIYRQLLDKVLVVDGVLPM